MFVGVSHTAICVSDMEQSIAFYRDILGMRIVSDVLLEGPRVDKIEGIRGMKARSVRLALDEGGEIQLIQHFNHKGKPAAVNLQQYDIGIVHICFTVKNINEIYNRLREKGVVLNCTVQENPFKFRSFSFKDPDEVELEVMEFMTGYDGRAVLKTKD